MLKPVTLLHSRAFPLALLMPPIAVPPALSPSQTLPPQRWRTQPNTTQPNPTLTRQEGGSFDGDAPPLPPAGRSDGGRLCTTPSGGATPRLLSCSLQQARAGWPPRMMRACRTGSSPLAAVRLRPLVLWPAAALQLRSDRSRWAQPIATLLGISYCCQTDASVAAGDGLADCAPSGKKGCQKDRASGRKAFPAQVAAAPMKPMNCAGG